MVNRYCQLCIHGDMVVFRVVMATPLQRIAALLSVVHLVTADVADVEFPPPEVVDLIEDWYRDFYEGLGAAYDAGKPIRDLLNAPLVSFTSFDDELEELKDLYAEVEEQFEQKKEKIKNNYNVAEALWDKMDLAGKSGKERVENIVNVISNELGSFLPIYSKIQSIEDISEHKYACGNRGYAHDLTKIKQVGKPDVKDSGGDFEVEVAFTIQGLQFVFEIFYINIRNIEQEGELYIDFGENLFKLKLKVASILNIPKYLALGQCIVHVTNFKVEKLVFLRSKFKPLPSNKRFDLKRFAKKRILNGGINYNLWAHQEERLRLRFQQIVLREIYNAMTSKNDFVCRDEGIVDKLIASGGSLDVPSFTGDFVEHCGPDEEVEPYTRQ